MHTHTRVSYQSTIQVSRKLSTSIPLCSHRSLNTLPLRKTQAPYLGELLFDLLGSHLAGVLGVARWGQSLELRGVDSGLGCGLGIRVRDAGFKEKGSRIEASGSSCCCSGCVVFGAHEFVLP